MSNYSFKDASGTTQTAASDLVSSVNYPYIKIIDGTAGNATNVAAITSSSALKVDISATAANTNKLLVTPDLPSGASTAAKQPALGTAGTASSDVITVQGIANMTKLLVTPDANSAVNVAQLNGVAPLMGNGVTGTGSMRVTIASDNTANSNPFLVTQTPATSGGLSMAAGSIGATKTAIKASAGQLFGWYFYNSNSSVAYVQIFNVASASVTLGTTVPDLSFGIPATSAANLEMTNGIAFGTAITIAITTTRTGSIGPSSTVDYNVFYK